MRKKKSKILKNVHENVTDLYKAGIIDKVTLSKFDGLCQQTVKPHASSSRVRGRR